ncbi:MAG: DUF1294 domain-containing protein [Firmicutes bacterium]|nr:DUF1294 domain-containing protein [Bacillota bacterium]MDY5531683.1 DUF1294 domain-containing protein [Pumilibacteraceae bacterium]
MKIWQIYLIAVAVMSVISFILYAVDKAKAKQKAWRTPEKVLLLSSFLLGAPGGYAAMLVFRHKTKHWYFQVVNLVSLALQIAVLIILFKIA